MVVIGIVGLAIVVAVVFVGFFLVNQAATQPQTSVHPAPSIVVDEYLTALSVGDGERAREFDGHILESDVFAERELGSFVSSQSLDAASERISDVSVSDVTSNEETATVAYEFTLAGEQFSGRINLTWDAATEAWLLDSSFAVTLTVETYVDDRLDSGSPNFTLGGVAPASLASIPNGNGLGYVVYPGVYDLVVDIDPAIVRDPAENPVTREIVVRPGSRLLEIDFPLLAQ